MFELFKLLWDVVVLRDAARKGQLNWRIWVYGFGFVIVEYAIALPAVLLMLLVVGCTSTYYKTMHTLGKEKRDVLIQRILDAKKIKIRQSTFLKSNWLNPILDSRITSPEPEKYQKNFPDHKNRPDRCLLAEQSSLFRVFRLHHPPALVTVL